MNTCKFILILTMCCACLLPSAFSIPTVNTGELESIVQFAKQPNDIIPLREYTDLKITALDKATDLKITALDKATDLKFTALDKATDLKFTAVNEATVLSRTILEKKLESMNEFRGQLKDQQQTFLTRTEFGLQTTKVEDMVRDLKVADTMFLPRSEFAILHGKLEDEIGVLRDYKSTAEGKASQVSVYAAYFLAILGIAAGMWKHKDK